MNKEYAFTCNYPFSYLGPLKKGTQYAKNGIICQKPWTGHPFITPHNHNYLEIEIITKGEGTHHIMGNDLRFKEKSFNIVPPNLLHGFTIDKPRLEFYNLCISLKAMPFEVTKLIYLAPLPVKGTLSDDELTLFEGYFKKLEELQDSNDPFAKEKIYAFVILILTLLLERGEGLKEGSDNSGYLYIEKAFDYIRENYASSIKLENIAEELHLSPSYFSRIFSKYMGYTFNEYLNYYRVRIAEELILESKKSLAEIAFEVGFGSLSSFSRAFNEFVGCSAREYKTKFKNN